MSLGKRSFALFCSKAIVIPTGRGYGVIVKYEFDWEVRDTPGFYDNPLWGHPALSAHGLSATPKHFGMQALGLWSAGPSSVAK